MGARELGDPYDGGTRDKSSYPTVMEPAIGCVEAPTWDEVPGSEHKRTICMVRKEYKAHTKMNNGRKASRYRIVIDQIKFVQLDSNLLQPGVIEEIALHKSNFAATDRLISHRIPAEVLGFLLPARLDGSSTVFKAVGIVAEASKQQHIHSPAAARDQGLSSVRLALCILGDGSANSTSLLDQNIFQGGIGESLIPG